VAAQAAQHATPTSAHAPTAAPTASMPGDRWVTDTHSNAQATNGHTHHTHPRGNGHGQC